MTPTQARAFLAVALKGSFSAAARGLRVSQPTVTNQVKQIERHYDVELFYRSGRGASLTPTGEALLPRIRTMFNSFEEANTFLDDLKGKRRGHLQIGSYGPYDVMNIVGRYRQRFPAVTLSVDFINSESLAENLLNYELDVAVLGASRPTEIPYAAIQSAAPCSHCPATVDGLGAGPSRRPISRMEITFGAGARLPAPAMIAFEKARLPGRIHQFGSREGGSMQTEGAGSDDLR